MISFSGRERRAKVREPSTDVGEHLLLWSWKQEKSQGERQKNTDREKDGVYSVMETRPVQVSRRQCPLVLNASDLSRRDAGFSNKNIISDL